MVKREGEDQLANQSNSDSRYSDELSLVDASHPDVSALFSHGKVCLAEIHQLDRDGYIVVNPLGTEVKVLAVSGQTYRADHIGKTVACIGIQNSHFVMIVGEVTVPQTQESVLDQLIDGYQNNKQSQDLDDSDVFAEPLVDVDYSISRDDMEEDLVFEAKRNILFKCGESSISLSADGRVHIRGKFVNNSASQLNRISGGTIKIN